MYYILHKHYRMRSMVANGRLVGACCSCHGFPFDFHFGCCCHWCSKSSGCQKINIPLELFLKHSVTHCGRRKVKAMQIEAHRESNSTRSTNVGIGDGTMTLRTAKMIMETKKELYETNRLVKYYCVVCVM